MLNPKNNRLDYGSLLSPPADYQLDFAVGSTYSLDLDSLVGASISLGLSGETDSDLNDNPIFLLEALRSAGDKIALFCESGQIKHPNKPTPLYILLEDMVFQVLNTNNVEYSRYASFHPKTWLVRYTDDNNNACYRFVVLSRNLTFDRSWDISFSMDGEITEEETDKNDPLIEFLKYQSEFSTDDEKTEKISEITEELKHVEFKLNSNVFDDFKFIVNGIGDEYSIQKEHLFTSESLGNIMIMSPFLSGNVIRDFNGRLNSKSRATLITRMDSLGRLKDENLNHFDFYALRDEVVDGESLFSEESNDFSKQDIHAKFYVVEKTKYVDFYLGSLNATHNALWGNVEFMIKLSARKNKFNIDKLSKDIFNGYGENNPFQPVEIEKIEDEKGSGSNLNLIIKKITRIGSKAKVIQKESSYDIEIEFEKDFSEYDIEISPLLSNKTAEFSRKVLFEDLDKTQLSEFFVISIKSEKETIRRVIKIPVENMPQDREKEVVSSVVKDKTAFIRYVAFLLGDEYILSSVDDTGDFGSDISDNSFTVQLPELYEKMLKASLYNPEKFMELEYLIKIVSGDDVIPEGFEEVYNTFKEVIDDG